MPYTRRRRNKHRFVSGGSDANTFDLDDSILPSDADNHLMNIDTSFDLDDNGSLHLSDLDVAEGDGHTTLPDDHTPMPMPELNLGFVDPGSEGETTFADDSFNLPSANTSLSTNFTDFSTDMSVGSMEGGKKRRQRPTRKRRSSKATRRKKRRTHKKRYVHKKRYTHKRPRRSQQLGGRCFGNGVGANSSDPNVSVYNSSLPTLFPYRA